MVEMHLVGVRVEMPTNTPIVLLREAGDPNRVLPIFIGPVEATAIAYALQGVHTPRPMTHDLLRDLLVALDVEVERIVITELRDRTFFADIHLVSKGASSILSSRPSDALALAARMGTPIFADEGVIDEVGVLISDDEEDTDVEVERFREFLKDVNPEDFAS